MNQLDEVFEVISPLLTELLEHEDLSTFQQGVSHSLSRLFFTEDFITDIRFQSSFAQALYYTMPLPKRKFAPEKQVKPGRNDACTCGSGRKFKHCCAGLPDIPADISDDLFSMALLHANNKLWNKLANHEHLPIHLRMIMVDHIIDEKKPKKLWQLVQPLFEHLDRINDNILHLVDLGFEALIDLGYEKKRFNYMIQMSEYSSNKAVQALGFQRLAMYSADQQDLANASRYLEKARRIAPENPDLPIVEMTLLPRLVSDQELRDRARFWQKRIHKLWGDDYPYIDVINAFAEGGMEAAHNILGYTDDLFEDERDEVFDYNEETISMFAERLHSILLSALGLTIEGIAKSKNVYHLGTIGSEIDALERFRRAWMTESQAKARPGMPKEYQDKWQDPDADWLTILEAEPQLLGHTTVLIELQQWLSMAPAFDNEELATLDTMLSMQRLCIINRIVKQCLDLGIQLNDTAEQNNIYFILLEQQMLDFIEDEVFFSAENLAFQIENTVKNARKAIRIIDEFLTL